MIFVKYCRDDKQKDLADKVPIHDVLLGMVVDHLPSPDISQRYRVPSIWNGDIETVEGQGMINTDPDSPLAVMITNVSIDKHAGEIATGRVYGGTIEKGTEIFFVGSHGKARTQQVGVYMGPERINTDKVPAGNIVAITGARNAMAGETVTNLGTKIRSI